MSKRKLLINFLIIFIVLGLTLYYLYKSGLIRNISAIGNIGFGGVLLITAIVLFYTVTDMLVKLFSLNNVNPNAKFREAVTPNLLGSLGSGATPWKAGHYPFMFYGISKQGYPMEKTITVLAENRIVCATSNILLYGTMALIAKLKNFSITVEGVEIQTYLVCLFGCLTNIAFTLGLTIVSYNRKIQQLVLNLEVFFKKKFKKLENEEEFRTEKLLKMKAYREITYRYLHQFYKYIIPIITYSLHMLTLFTLPYVIYLLLSHEGFSFSKAAFFFTINQAMYYVTNIIPIPGGTGVAEFSFIAVYSGVMGDDYVSSAMLVYRLFSYFFVTIAGFLYFSWFLFKKKKEKIQDAI